MIIAGIGSSIPFHNVRHHLYDRIHWINLRLRHVRRHRTPARQRHLRRLSAGAAYLTTLWEQKQDTDPTYIFLAADTGHRYVDTAYAHHTAAPGLGTMRPHEVTTQNELKHPWSAMNWPPPDNGLLHDAPALMAEPA